MSVKKTTATVFKPELDNAQPLPFVSHGVSAGFPSPALDFMESRIDLNKALSEHPLATFYIRVQGDSMTGAGIDDQDLLVVDRSLEPQNHKIAVCFVDGEFTVKRIKRKKDELWLMPENPKYPPIQVTDETQLMIWGIVTYVIKAVK